jgi:dipeptidyl aminopeptidase/acylaminoacyl peptidase
MGGRGREHGWTALLVGLAFVFCILSDARAADAPAVSAVFGRLPSLEDVALSPNGSQLAWARNEGERHFAVVSPADGSRPSFSLDLGGQKLRSIQWADDHILLLTVSATEFPPLGWWGDRREWYFLETYDVRTQQLRPVTLDVPDYQTFNIMTDAPMIRIVDGATMLFIRGSYVAHFSENFGNHIRFTKRRLPALFRYDVAAHRTRLIALGEDSYARWVVDDSGQISADFTYEESGRHWTLRARTDGKMTTVAQGQALLDLPRIVGSSVDGTVLYVRFIEEGAVVWKPLSIKDGTWGAPLANGEAFDGVIKERLTGRIVGGSYGVDADGYVFFDPQSQGRWNTVLQAFAGEHVRLVSHTDDFSKLIVQVFGSTHGYVYELIDWNPVRAQPLGSIYEDLGTIAPVQSIRYPAADGLDISAVLTLPRDRPARNLPLVVMPHDGPASVVAARFNWWTQALAALGYAVLQPNFRGSNLNRHFVEAGFGEWGRKMQTDLSDGVRYLAQQGVADPARVCIAGLGYGGYAALAGVTLQQGVYRCAISVGGIGDLKRFLAWANEHAGGVTERSWDRFLGIAGSRDVELKSISPLEHVAADTVPVLLVHGSDDTEVPPEQSEVMADALKRAGGTAQLVKLKNEDHWLSRSATRQQMLDAAVAFLQINNPAR